MMGVGDDDVGVSVDDAIDGLGSEASVSAEASMDAGLDSGDYGWGDISAVETGPGDPGGYGGGYDSVLGALQGIGINIDNIQTNAPNMDPDALESLVQYGPTASITPSLTVSPYTDQTDIDLATIEDVQYGFPVSEADTSAEGATFPSMYDTVEPPPVISPPPQTPSYNPGPQSYLDTIISNFTNPEKRSYLVSQRRMNMPLTEGYYDPRGNYQSLRQMFPDVFSADFVEVASPTQMAYGGLATNDQNRLRAIQQVYGQPQATGIRSLSPNRQYAQGGNVMRNIRDEEARVIGVQDDAADQMNRIRYHSGRDARDERFRVAARERDAREEMGRLRGEARYQGARAFNQGGVASLAPVARNMFRKRRLPRAGMVA